MPYVVSDFDVALLNFRFQFCFFSLEMYETIIAFGFCDTQNYQCLGKSF